MVEKEKKEESWLRKLCGDDAKLYEFLARRLPLDPMAAISKEDVGILIEQAEKSVKDENYEEAVWKYRLVVDKAIFEATQHQEERDRYIKLIQDLLSKTAQATERAKEKVEKKGLTDRVASLVKWIEDCKFVSERIEDVLEVARQFYDERLKILGEKEKGEERREAKRADRMEEDREKREERPEKRDKKREKEKRDKRLEEDNEEKREEEEEKEKGEERREKMLNARR
ncbi:MAG: hypothetical protein ABSA92_15350 [Candidatus Bathyarchaeia archaeon]